MADCMNILSVVTTDSGVMDWSAFHTLSLSPVTVRDPNGGDDRMEPVISHVTLRDRCGRAPDGLSSQAVLAAVLGGVSRRSRPVRPGTARYDPVRPV